MAHSKTLKVFVADDEDATRDRLKDLIRDQDGLICVGEAADGLAASHGIKDLSPDIVFLDVHMPKATGLFVAENARKGARSAVVFITAHHDFAAEAFSLDAADYILKPITSDRLATAVAKARRWLESSEVLPDSAALPPEKAGESRFAATLAVTTRAGRRYVDVDTIIWVEAAKDYVVLHTSSRALLMRGSMDALEATLDPAQLLRVSRSAIVRIGAVTATNSVGRTFALVLNGDTCVRVGATYQRNVKAALDARRKAPPGTSLVDSAGSRRVGAVKRL